MCQLEKDGRTGLWYRPETNDLSIIRSQQAEYGKLGDIGDARIMDIGGHIGAFAQWALARDASFIDIYEPAPANLALLCFNMYSENRVSIHSWAIAHINGITSFYLARTKDMSSHRLVMTKGRATIDVVCRSLESAVEDIHPSVIKMDIEGGEYLLQDDFVLLPECVRKIAIEFHFPHRNLAAMQTILGVMNKDWHALREPKFNEKSWNTVGIWERNLF